MIRDFGNCRHAGPIITARKRSLVQGNKFTGVCLSTGGGWFGGVSGPGVPGLGDAWSRGGPGPRRGVWSWGGCLVWGGLVPEGVPDPTGVRAVRILLECILVYIYFRGRSNWKVFSQ